jgi:hypothetical protein
MEKSITPKRNVEREIVILMALQLLLSALEKYFGMEETWYTELIFWIILPIAYLFTCHLLWKRKLKKMQQTHNATPELRPSQPDRQ